MSIFDKPAWNRACGRRLKFAALLGAAVAMTQPVYSYAGEAGGMMPTAMRPKAGARMDGAARGFELRCWQEGRLILEEHFLKVPPESSADALRMNDTAGRPVRVLETANATCLLKAVPRPPRAPRP